ncbi:hypothetical protein [Parapedobacter indicus]|uniref:Uncharacterized protein n=1 Tax=Parapedobacter indicus TaxID=1477437 RepID=A0A1I3E0V8_9SPHI|nr:hypothetical protein [Parapedobacter indicus]PPL04920.1 hypothetical protein CLV26_101730 [Parapedobacter indicus]SFH92533.1 hypothetical protein SAMN05444682_101716 [Parapedobacter indicus]
MNKELQNEIIKEAVLEATDHDSKVCELIIREGKALPALEPLKVKIAGILDSPFRFLQKRVGEIDQKKAFITVNRESLTITLDFNEDDPYSNGQIVGVITEHPTFKKFGINSGHYRTTYEMAELIKMNRSAFENIQVAMKLVHELKNFKAKVEKDLEKNNDDRGNRKILLQQTVESNVPEKFKVVMPIFKGMPKETFEVEVYFNPDDLTCTLVSPEANDTLEEIRDSAIDEVLHEIEEIAPDIVIIEK